MFLVIFAPPEREAQRPILSAFQSVMNLLVGSKRLFSQRTIGRFARGYKKSNVKVRSHRTGRVHRTHHRAPGEEGFRAI